jgi:Nucleotidyl transferase AbiEii toxin, Type IV TA system
MKRLTEAQSELIDAFLAEHAARVSTAQLEKDFLISEVFSVFTEPVLYQGHEAKFVLCGGTAVSKAHRFTERISEDVDLRVIVPNGLSRSGQKRLLSRVKADVVNRLRERGYDIPEEAVKAGNENRYIAIVLAYESLYPADQALRPELLIEISARPPILTPVVCGYDTIVNEMLGRAARTGTIACLDIRETIGGKNAALLRRWSARLRGAGRVFELGNARDEDIVRHIYDLGCIFQKFPQELTGAEAGRLARQLLLQDAEEFGGQDPGFKEAPIERALDALNDLVENAEAKQWYERFGAAMVYGAIPAFDEAMTRIRRFADAWASAVP